ncbi:MAG TPA: cysteine desulfurase CsdA [Bacteroidales bacterium]|nr:cysteine desulfurase CsdA [Bacteroidales bacterium]
MKLNVDELRTGFPSLHQMVNGHKLVYFDNAATTLKPQIVIDRLNAYYQKENSNIHRGAHYLSSKATAAYENARCTIQKHLNAAHSHEIIFTRGTTEAINLVAASFSKKFIHEGDEIVVSAMEHHSNIVPWQLACADRKATLRVIPVNNDGELVLDDLDALLNEKTRMVAVAHVSNALGTVNPVEAIIAKAHQRNIPVLIDGAQAAPHMKIDVAALDCDFYCFSSHKVYGPMGVGVLYGKEQWLEQMPPYQGGGEMIKEVKFSGTTFNELPFKFEAGTPNVGDVLGLESALKYLTNLQLDAVANHEYNLIQYAIEKLKTLENIKLMGSPAKRAGVVSFLFTDIHPYDTGTILDKMGIAVRTGSHCAQPLMDILQVPGTVRISFGVYNTFAELDYLIDSLVKIRKLFT